MCRCVNVLILSFFFPRQKLELLFFSFLLRYVNVLICWCADVLIIMLMCWCVDMLMCWFADITLVCIPLCSVGSEILGFCGAKITKSGNRADHKTSGWSTAYGNNTYSYGTVVWKIKVNRVSRLILAGVSHGATHTDAHMHSSHWWNAGEGFGYYSEVCCCFCVECNISTHNQDIINTLTHQHINTSTHQHTNT